MKSGNLIKRTFHRSMLPVKFQRFQRRFLEIDLPKARIVYGGDVFNRSGQNETTYFHKISDSINMDQSTKLKQGQDM